MVDLLKEIAQAHKNEIGELVNAVLRRYNELFQDWEISAIALQKSSDKNKQIDRIIAILQTMKTSS